MPDSSTLRRLSASFIQKSEAMRGALALHYPMENGVVSSWEDMETIWRYVYEHHLKLPETRYEVPSTACCHLCGTCWDRGEPDGAVPGRPRRRVWLEQWNIDPSAIPCVDERPILLSEAPLTSFGHREHAAELLIESLGVPALYFAVQGVLALYAAGKTTGLVCDSGAAATYVLPVYRGFGQPHTVGRLEVGGRAVTARLSMLLSYQGHAFRSSAEREVVREMKEDMCYIALSTKKETQRPRAEISREYRLPDGQMIIIDNQRFLAPETLFDPSLVGMDAPGMHLLTYNSIMQSDIDVRRDLFGNVLLAGGSSLFPGLKTRLSQCLRSMAPDPASVRVSAPRERKQYVWIGGSILASLSAFQSLWLTAAEYHESGLAGLHRLLP
uniref:uncharacterized protein isoform X2 n=1 Tax=Myxine glutinosa TaxID=7769 RepID=UPI00358ED849